MLIHHPAGRPKARRKPPRANDRSFAGSEMIDALWTRAYTPIVFENRAAIVIYGMTRLFVSDDTE
jgi:hypothetical protein